MGAASAQISGELIPQEHGGALRHPYPKGVSGNPGGRPKTKHLTQAYVRVGLMSPEKRRRYKPENGFEEGALAAFRLGTQKRARVEALKEIADRVEGKAATAPEDREIEEQANTLRQAEILAKYLPKLKKLGLL